MDNLIDWNLLTPRLGAAYDLAGDGKTILKFNYGQFGFSPGLDLGFNASPNSSLWWRKSSVARLEPQRRVERGRGRSEQSAREPRWHRAGIIGPALELPVLKELAGWVERDLSASVGLRTGIVWRGETEHFMRQNLHQPFDAFSVPVPIRDPGPDGRFDTPDDGPAIGGYALRPDIVGVSPSNVVRNVPDSDTSHLTWEIVATRRFKGRWSLVAGFAHTWSRDQASVYSGQPFGRTRTR